MAELTLADIPQRLKDQIIAEYHRERMAKLGRKSSEAKKAASRANLAKVNERWSKTREQRYQRAKVAVDRGRSITWAARNVAKTRVAAFRTWLEEQE